MADISSELCGGTHVSNTAQIRLFRIISESSVATGIRRIEAVTGSEALKLYNREREAVNQICHALKTDLEQAPAKVNHLIEENNKYQKELAKLSQEQASEQVKELFAKIKTVNGVKYVVARLDGLSMDLLREAVDKLRDQMGSGVAALGTVNDGKVAFVVGVTKDLTGKVQAGSLIKAIAAETGGSGGGRPDLAQAGGKDASKIDQALEIGEKKLLEILG